MAEKLHPGQRPPDWRPPETTASRKHGLRWRHWVLIVFGGLIVIGMFAPKQEGADTGSVASSEAASPAPLPAERKVTSVELSRMYDANEVAAQGFANAGPLQVTGRVESIELDFSDDPVVQLQGKDDFSRVAVYFGKDASSLTASLAKGMTLVVQCDKISEILGSPQLKDCSIPVTPVAE